MVKTSDAQLAVDIVQLVFGDERPDTITGRSDRYIWNAEIQAQPLDDDMQPTGRPLTLQARDISEGGIGFNYRHNLADDYLLVTIPTSSADMNIPIEIIWDEKLSTDSFFRFGGGFISNDSSDAWKK